MINILLKNFNSFKLLFAFVCILLNTNNLSAQSLLKDVRPGSQSSFPNDFAKINNQLYFVAIDGVNGYELYKSDGTEAGTFMIKDINPGAGHNNLTAISDLNGIAIFNADNGVNGIELWRSDGTEQGTYMIKDIRPGSVGSDIFNMITIGNIVYFDANDGTNGQELWRTDGTTNGTVMVKDIAPGFSRSGPSFFHNLNGKLIFVADNVLGNEIWVSDGTSAGTFMLADITNTTSRPFSINSTPFFTQIGNVVYFAPYKNNSTGMSELWKTDGTSQGTNLVTEIKISTGASANRFAAINNKLIFCASDINNGDEIWVSDGTAAGTTLLKDINPGTAHSYARDVTVLNNHIYFTADDGLNSFELWKTDGTTNGTIIVKNIHPTGSANVAYLFAHNNLLYFRATDGTGSISWKTDGTESGTTQAWSNRNINHGLTDSNGDPIIASVDNTLFFRNGTGDVELWKYDGLSSSITSIKINDFDIYPNPTSNKFTVNTNNFESGNIKIIDLNGRVILTEKINQRDNIQFNLALANGIYIIELENQSIIVRKKLIVNN